MFLNLLGLHFAPVAYAIDFTNDKRFYYAQDIHLDLNDSLREIETPIKEKWDNYFSEDFPQSKHDINWTISIPYLNDFYFRPDGLEAKGSTGFWGISTGVEYFYKEKKHLSLRLLSAVDLFTPVPASISEDGPRERFSTRHIEITDNFMFRRFHFGYGFNYSYNNRDFIDDSNLNDIISIDRRNKSFGISLNTYLQLTEGLFVGVLYRPSFFSVRPLKKLQYEHLLSLDFAFKILLKKRKHL